MDTTKFTAQDWNAVLLNNEASKWWSNVLSINEHKTLAYKNLLDFEAESLVGSTSQYVTFDYQAKLIQKIWENEGKPTGVEYGEDPYKSTWLTPGIKS